jgi:hypothetical protein
VTADAREVVGVPTSVDLGIDAAEVFLHPEGDDLTEIVVAIPQIARAEFA